VSAPTHVCVSLLNNRPAGVASDDRRELTDDGGGRRAHERGFARRDDGGRLGAAIASRSSGATVWRRRGSRANSSLGAVLLFDQNNIRYVTSTHIGEWARDKSARCALLPREGDPVLWDFGSRPSITSCTHHGCRNRAGRRASPRFAARCRANRRAGRARRSHPPRARRSRTRGEPLGIRPDGTWRRSTRCTARASDATPSQ